MKRHMSDFQLLSLRRPLLVWLLLLNFCCFLIPSFAFAQSVSATIRSLTGNVIVSGQKARVGVVLRSGDSIQTWRNSSALLRLSDGSEIQLGENTRINIDDLSQTSSGGRKSALTALVGWMRATLSPGHQHADSSFTVNTPNAQIGARFSQPKFSVYVSPDQKETWAMAHTVELGVTNRLSGETVIVPVGSSVIIKGMLIQVFPRILEPYQGPGNEAGPGNEPPSGGGGGTGPGLSTGTKVLIGAGALAIAGGVTALIISNNDTSSDNNSNDNNNGDNLEPVGQCEDVQLSGSDTSESHEIEMGQRSGSFLFGYQFSYAPSRLIIEYEGQPLFDSGCVLTEIFETRELSFSGQSSKITVQVIPNCRDMYDSSAMWEVYIHCP